MSRRKRRGSGRLDGSDSELVVTRRVLRRRKAQGSAGSVTRSTNSISGPTKAGTGKLGTGKRPQSNQPYRKPDLEYHGLIHDDSDPREAYDGHSASDHLSDSGYKSETEKSREGRFNRSLRLVLLLAPLVWFLTTRAAYRPGAYIGWLAAVLATRHVALEALVLPPLVAGALAPPHHSRVILNMALSLSTTRSGAVLAVIWLWYVERGGLWAPLALQAALYVIGKLAQNSIPASEAAFLATGIVNVALATEVGEWRTLLLCGLAGLVPCYPLLVEHAKRYRQHRGQSSHVLVASIYIVYFATAGYLYFGVCHRSWDWTMHVVASNRGLVMWWVACLTIGGIIAALGGGRLGLDARRKLWHVCSVALFFPTAAHPFTSMALAVALVLFVLLETVRATALPPAGLWIHRTLQPFVDSRDTRGPIVVSHLYLLLGISSPIFAAHSPVGVLGLGVGDTCASQVGRRIGRIRLFGKKTLEGTLAFACAVALCLCWGQDYVWRRALLVGAAAALMEAVGTLNDNLVVPVYMLALTKL